MKWPSVRTGSIVGALVGALVALVAFAPATWLATAVTRATENRLVLAEAQGTLWSGSAMLVLTGGPGSLDAVSLPGRFQWKLRPADGGMRIDVQQECCLNEVVSLRVRPGLARTTIELLPRPGWTASWPSSLLRGMGTPWNTLQLGGAIRFSSSGLTFQQASGRWTMRGRADIQVLDASSPLSTVEPLGSYRLDLEGDDRGHVRAELSTTEGALQLSGDGDWGPGGVRFRGEARASQGSEAALNNLLNIIGRREGARSIISIG